MTQMEEYRLGDWVSGARHEAEGEVIIENTEEEPEIIFIDENAEDVMETTENNKVENLGQPNPDKRMIESEKVMTLFESEKFCNLHHQDQESDTTHIIVTVLIVLSLVSLVTSLVGALRCRRCRHAMQKVIKVITCNNDDLILQKLDDPETWRAREMMESAAMTMSDLVIMEK